MKSNGYDSRQGKVPIARHSRSYTRHWSEPVRVLPAFDKLELFSRIIPMVRPRRSRYKVTSDEETSVSTQTESGDAQPHTRRDSAGHPMSPQAALPSRGGAKRDDTGFDERAQGPACWP
jgi:hypothetical protein